LSSKRVVLALNIGVSTFDERSFSIEHRGLSLEDPFLEDISIVLSQNRLHIGDLLMGGFYG
jgi:hypothetical protein